MITTIFMKDGLIMKLGLVSAILPEKSFEEVVDLVSENGFKSIEVMCWPTGKADRRYAGVTHIDVNDLDDKKIKHIKEYTSMKGIEISALGYYPNPLDSDIEKRDIYIRQIKRIIESAKKLDVDTITTFIGKDPKKTIKENMDEFKKVWPDIIRFAEENKIKVAIENCPMYFTIDEWPSGKNLATSPQIFREMFRIIDSDYFGLNYDPSHFLWQQMDYLKPIYEFKEKLFHIHIKDGKIHKDKLDDVGILATPLEFFSPKIPGLGDIDWGKFISALTDVRYKGHVAIEIEDEAFEESLEDRIRAIKQSKKHVEQFLTE